MSDEVKFGFVGSITDLKLILDRLTDKYGGKMSLREAFKKEYGEGMC